MSIGSDPLLIALFFAALALLPLLLIACTAFLKIVIVLMVTRNALGVQQVPPAMALYAMAMILTLFVMAPTFTSMMNVLNEEQSHHDAKAPVMETVVRVGEPLRAYMLQHARQEQRESFLDKAKKLWPAKQAGQAKSTDFVIVMPAFMVSEMQAGFEMAFLIYLPFLVIDLIVSNVLLSLGMQMMSPLTVSLPLKLFLFVAVDGWGRLLNGLLTSYIT